MNRLRVIENPRPSSIPRSPEIFLAELAGPALLRLTGKDSTRTRALSVLLHGNEPSSFLALQAWLRKGVTPAVNVVAFVGAVEAALLPPGFAYRMTPGRRDLNRCFRPPFSDAEGQIAEQAIAFFRAARPEALIDLHNNTGRNPAYGLGPVLSPRVLALSALFASRFLHNPLRLGTLVEAFADAIPAVTIECGLAGDPHANGIAATGLARFLGKDDLFAAPDPGPSLVLVDPVRVHIRPHVTFGFGDRPLPGLDLTLAADIDRHNFQTLARDMRVGWLRPASEWPFEILAPDGTDVSRRYFGARDGELVVLEDFIPVMLTTRPEAVRCDCLCYLVREGEG